MSFYSLLTLQKINSKSASKWFGTAKQKADQEVGFLFYRKFAMRTIERWTADATAPPRRWGGCQSLEEGK